MMGATYLAVNGLGWSIATSPFEAIAGLNLNYQGNKRTFGSKKWKEEANRVNLWFIPDQESFHGTNNYEPVNKDGAIAGIPLSLIHI